MIIPKLEILSLVRNRNAQLVADSNNYQVLTAKVNEALMAAANSNRSECEVVITEFITALHSQVKKELEDAGYVVEYLQPLTHLRDDYELYIEF